MTFKQFKISTFLVLVTSIVFAQKYDKKFNENFKTNKDAVVTINASNATIDVTTWNKNEVSVEAIIEVEGLDKKAAEKYFKNWKFEALGNKNKVQINANNSNVHSFGNDNIVFFNSSKSNHPNIYQYNTEGSKVIVIPEIPEIPEIEIPEMPELPEIVIPEINFEEIVSGLDHIEFDFDKYAKDGGTYFFQWKDGVNDITIKSKKEWEAFKKSKKYKKFKKAQEKRKIALKKELKEVRATLNKKELKREIAKARAEIKRVNRKEVRRELLKAREEIKRVRKEVKNVHYSYSTGSNNFMVDGKKVKVTKKLVIKVPKNATFDLNTRHCKVKLPKTKASGRVSYGTFKADVLNGGKLNISFSPVNINSLNACTVFLNNVTDAHVASVANTTLKANSSGLTIDVVRENTEIDSEFGELSINKVISDFNLLKIFLNYSNSTMKISDLDSTISIDSKKGKFEYDDVIESFNKIHKKQDLSVKFIHPSKTSKNKIILTANYSNIKLK